MLKRELRRASEADTLCECGHPICDHRTYAPRQDILNGQIVEVTHPRYRPNLFRCHAEGCDCEISP